MEGITTKKGNQLYVEFQVYDKDGQLLDINGVSKVQFNIGELTKTYDGVSEEVTYDKEEQCFRVWLTEDETFGFDNYTKMDVRVLFLNNTIMGSYIEKKFIYDSLKEIKLDEKGENTNEDTNETSR